MSLWNRLLGRGGSRGRQRTGGLDTRADAVAPKPERAGTVLRHETPAAAAPLRATDDEPQTIGDYAVKRRLGAGSMGAVYLVQHPSWNVDVALKVPQPELIADEHNRHRITREAESWTELGLHPNITYCYYIQSVQELLFVVIEYVDGGNLADWIAARRTTDLKTALDLAIQFCHGLEHAHGRGMIHRDIKPENVLITKEGQLKITDFGIARTGAKDGDRTHEGVAGVPDRADGTMIGIGTEDYMAPEQWVTGKLDARADLFALGVCLYEMLCGRRPYEKAVGPRQEAPEPAALRGGQTLPSALCELMKRCVDWTPQHRPGSAKEIREQLCEIYQQQFNELNAYAELPQFSVAAAALNNRALSYLVLGKAEEAERAWQAALEADPRHIEAVYNYGLHLWRTARLTDDALLRRLEEASADRPAEWLSKLLRAQVYLESGDGESAKRVLEDIAPSDAQREQVLAAKRRAAEMIASSDKKRTFNGHAAEVSSACLSADGRDALSGSADGTLKFWEVATGQCLCTFTGHTSGVESVCLSADAHHALSGSSDKTLKLWDVRTGGCLRTFTGHTDRVTSVYIGADGRYALSGSSDKTVKLWEVKTGKSLRTFAGHTDRVTSVYIGADGRYVLSGSSDKTVKLWEVKTGKCLRSSFIAHAWKVHSVCLSADGSRAGSGGYDDQIKIWHVASGQCLRTLTGHTGGVREVCLSADGRYVLSRSYDKTIKLWDGATGQCLRSFTQPIYAVNSICLSADGRYVLSGIGDRTVKLWTLPTGVPVAVMQLSLGAASADAIGAGVRFRQALNEFGRAVEKGDIRMAHGMLEATRAGDYRRHPDAFEAWSRLYTRMYKTRLHDYWKKDLSGENIHSCCLSPDSRYALAGSWLIKLKLWKVTTGQCLYIIDHTGAVSRNLSADGRHTASCDTSTIKLWEVTTGQCVRTLNVRDQRMIAMCLAPDGRFALAGGENRTLKLWDIATGQCLRSFTGHTNLVTSVCLSADGRYAFSGSWDNTLKLWDVRTGECLRTFTGHARPVHSVHLSADGSRALSGSDDKTLKLWNIANGECLRIFGGHGESVMSVHLSADGRYALSGSKDRTLKLWNVETSECLRTFTGHTKPVRSVCLSADGGHVLSGGDDGLKLWYLDWKLDETEPADWDEGARPYLEVFLRAQQPYTAALPQDRTPSEEEITAALTRSGEPVWTEEDFKRLLYTLGCVGYGWLRPEGIRRELEAMRQRPETFE